MRMAARRQIASGCEANCHPSQGAVLSRVPQTDTWVCVFLGSTLFGVVWRIIGGLGCQKEFDTTPHLGHLKDALGFILPATLFKDPNNGPISNRAARE